MQVCSGPDPELKAMRQDTSEQLASRRRYDVMQQQTVLNLLAGSFFLLCQSQSGSPPLFLFHPLPLSPRMALLLMLFANV